jgi:radical SAM superfamily enzyme YgiQ (UPF0313 family)
MDFSKAHIPLGLLYLASSMQQRGHEVNTYDVDYNPKGKSLPFIAKMEHYHDYIDGLNNDDHPIWKEIEATVNKLDPQVAGISVISTKLLSGFKVAEKLKKMGLEKVIMGGAHATIDPEEVIANPFVDSVVSGEGEEVFEQAMRQDGIIRAQRIQNLDSLPWPARSSLINLDDYQPSDLGMVISVRGCPYDCNFCCSKILWGRDVRKRNIGSVVDEIDKIHSDFGVDDFYIIDDTFTMEKQRVMDFTKKMEERPYTWACLTRVNIMDEEIVGAMKNSGCRMAKVGVESGSERVLRLMNKKITNDDVRNASRLFKEFDLPWLAYIIVGTPGETESEVDETLRFMEEVKPTYISFSNFTPYPGTSFYTMQGLGRIDYHLYNHHSAEQTGQISPKKIMEAAKFIDEYNKNSKIFNSKKS